MRDLENCRQEIDEIDAELVRLFERRMGVCRDVALYKQAHYMDILNAARRRPCSNPARSRRAIRRWRRA
ncbi:MAG: chorismate mutase [Christensenellales bacterium]